MRTKQKPRHFVRLSFSPTPMHGIICKADYPPLSSTPYLHDSSCLSPPADLGQSCVSVEVAVTATFVGPRLFFMCSHEWTTSPNSPRRRWRPFQSSCAQAKAPSSDARITYASRHRGFQRLMAACMHTLSVSITACQYGLRRIAHSGSHFRG
jgi:hypothetical protein